MDIDEMQDVPKEIADTLELTQFGQDAIDGVVDVVEVVRNNPIVLVAVGAVGLAVGAAAGYFFAKNQLKSYYEDLSSQEIAEAKEFYSGVYKIDENGEDLTPQEMLEKKHGVGAVAEAVRRYQGVVEDDVIAEAKDEQGHPSDEAMDEAQIRKLEAEAKKPKRQYRNPVSEVEESKEETYEEYEPSPARNVFEDNSFNMDEEMAMRSEDSPYIITHDEFYAAEQDYETVELAYFEEDDTLVGEDSKPIENTDEQVGDNNLLRFGSGSKDPNIVFVRNDRLEIDYEIHRSTGSYLEEVLGLMSDDETNSLRHSNRNAQLNRRREFRRGDE
jgi:hypothetical protein